MNSSFYDDTIKPKQNGEPEKLRVQFPVKDSLGKVTQEVEKLERIKDLCGQILLTLTLERNQEHIPAAVKELAAMWQKQFESLK